MAAHDSKGASGNGLLTWVLIGGFCILLMGIMVWMAGSNAIVYYMSPVFYWLSAPWRWVHQLGLMRFDMGTDILYQHVANRRFPQETGFGDWARYVNITLKPAAILAAVTMFFFFFRMAKAAKIKRVNKNLSPEQLAEELSLVFSDIAPVVKIQKQLIDNRYTEWRRQTFPEELIRQAKHQGQSVLIPNPQGGEPILDEERLRGFLTRVSAYKYGKLTLRRSPHLGRQLVSVKHDAGDKELVLPDRLSDVGKAIYALLAPYAFGGPKGRQQSLEVKDALNYSAYGSKLGFANLALPQVQASFNDWRQDPLAKKLITIHHWEHTFLFALLEVAQRNGKIGTWQCIWLKPMDRSMFYSLNTVGRKTPHSESGLAFSQHQFEQLCARNGWLPIDKQGAPVIFADKAIDALREEWDAWVHGDDDETDWWKGEGLIGTEKNAVLIQELLAASVIPKPPPGAE